MLVAKPKHPKINEKQQKTFVFPHTNHPILVALVFLLHIGIIIKTKKREKEKERKERLTSKIIF